LSDKFCVTSRTRYSSHVQCLLISTRDAGSRVSLFLSSLSTNNVDVTSLSRQ